MEEKGGKMKDKRKVTYGNKRNKQKKRKKSYNNYEKKNTLKLKATNRQKDIRTDNRIHIN